MGCGSTPLRSPFGRPQQVDCEALDFAPPKLRSMGNGIVKCPQAGGRTGARIFQCSPNLSMSGLGCTVHLDGSLSLIRMAVI